MALDVKVKIDLTYPTGSLGFGYPLILNIGTAKAYAEYKSVQEVEDVGFDAKSTVYQAAALLFGQSKAPEKIAICGVADSSDLTDIKGKGWRQLVALNAEEADVKAIEAYVSTTEDKIYFACVADAAALANLGTSDRVVGFVHSNALAAAALAGEAAGREAGSFTYKNLILTGIDPMSFSDTEIDAIHAANGFTFVTKCGDNVTTEGKTMSGEYIDIVDSKDWIVQQLAYETQKVLNKIGKVPYDNNGIAMLETAAVNVLQGAYNNGIIATAENGNPDYTVAYALSANVSDADKADRVYKGGQFSFKLAGAIHEAEITGEILI